jgi:hypothetical protein
MKQIIAVFLLVFLFLSCESKQYSLQKLDSFSFRRNFFGADTLSGEVLKIYLNRNPTTDEEYNENTHPFYPFLAKEKVIANNQLYLNKLDTLYNSFNYTTDGKDFTVFVDFAYISETDSNNFIFDFKIEDDLIIRDTLVFGFPPDVIFSKMDLNQNGTDELYALFKNYSLNGDNFELSVYELK